ncbi:MAG: hypothetical protein JWM74_4406, partial [Myxococcaceae bacterium]|nr:hypothetical protein [Myxococcaceae bacterium]
GGAGGAGQNGQPGGAGGAGGCAGGPGGDGAGGGGGTGGSGGISIAIGFKGTGPIIDGVVHLQDVIDGGAFDASIGLPGAGGSLGAKGPGTGAGGSPDGLPGVAGRPGVTRMIGVSP